MRSKTLPGSICRRPHQVEQVRQVGAHRRGAAADALVGPEQLVGGQVPVRDADQADHAAGTGVARPPGRGPPRCRRTPAPRPRRCRRSARGPGPGPPRRARRRCGWRRTPWRPAWRAACRLIAMMVVAPSWAAARTPLRPTAPSPTTTTLVPGPTPAETAACQPVHITSERASRLGIRSASGCPGVAMSVPSAFGMRIISAWQPSKPPPCWQLACMPLRQTGQVLSLCRNPPTTKSPGCHGGDGVADLLDDPDVLVPDRGRPRDLAGCRGSATGPTRRRTRRPCG